MIYSYKFSEKKNKKNATKPNFCSVFIFPNTPVISL